MVFPASKGARVDVSTVLRDGLAPMVPELDWFEELWVEKKLGDRIDGTG